jgi:hypothetical protein
MAFKVQCPGCGKNYNLSAQFAGKKVSCKDCGAMFRVGSSTDGESGASMVDDLSVPNSPVHSQPITGSKGGPFAGRGQNPYRAPSDPVASAKQPAVPTNSGSNPNALVALILGILSLVMSPVGFLCGCLGGCPCILVAGGAITTGIIGLVKSKEDGKGGKGQSLTGLILGIVAILATILAFVLLFVLGFATEMQKIQDEFGVNFNDF